MEFTKNSIQIPNKKEYLFRLEMDDIKGIIRLTKNRDYNATTRITDRNIPISNKCKWLFHRGRSGYSPFGSLEYDFIGSYIDRNKFPTNYFKWKNFILRNYKIFKQNYSSKSKTD